MRAVQKRNCNFAYQSSRGHTLGILLDFHNGAHAVITSLNGPPFSICFAVFGNKGWMELHDESRPKTPHGSTLTTCKHGGPAEKRHTRRCRWFRDLGSFCRRVSSFHS